VWRSTAARSRAGEPDLQLWTRSFSRLSTRHAQKEANREWNGPQDQRSKRASPDGRFRGQPVLVSTDSTGRQPRPGCVTEQRVTPVLRLIGDLALALACAGCQHPLAPDPPQTCKGDDEPYDGQNRNHSVEPNASPRRAPRRRCGNFARNSHAAMMPDPGLLGERRAAVMRLPTRAADT
jgi:hypothetical protein